MLHALASEPNVLFATTNCNCILDYSDISRAGDNSKFNYTKQPKNNTMIHSAYLVLYTKNYMMKLRPPLEPAC